METVTFTCTVTGDRMNWETSDVTRITIRNSSNLNVPMMPRPGYTLTLKAFTNSTMTSTLSRVAEDGIIVSCVDPLPTLTTIGTTTISLVGELLSLLIMQSAQVCHRIHNNITVVCARDQLFDWFNYNYISHRSTRTTFHHASLYPQQFS